MSDSSGVVVVQQQHRTRSDNAQVCIPMLRAFLLPPFDGGKICRWAQARASHSRTPFAVSCLQQILTRPPADKTRPSKVSWKATLASSYFIVNPFISHHHLPRASLSRTVQLRVDSFPKHSSRLPRITRSCLAASQENMSQTDHCKVDLLEPWFGR